MTSGSVNVACQNIDDMVLLLIDTESTAGLMQEKVDFLRDALEAFMGPTLKYGAFMLPGESPVSITCLLSPGFDKKNGYMYRDAAWNLRE